MKILVTGGAGFIGSHFVERSLGAGHSVEVVDEFNDFYDPAIKRANVAGFAKDAAIHEADIRDGDAVRRIVAGGKFDCIVHLAARAGVRPTGTCHWLDGAHAPSFEKLASRLSTSLSSLRAWMLGVSGGA